jgi:hypothetical protein
LKIDKDEDSNVFYVYLKDGAILAVRTYLYDMYLYMSEKAITDINDIKWGISAFAFRFQPKMTIDWNQDDVRLKYAINSIFEPYAFNWDGTMEGLTGEANSYSCSRTGIFCTKLIQLNGWKIPKDYPKKF